MLEGLNGGSYDDLVAVVDTRNDEAFSSGAVGQLLVVRAQSVAQSVDEDFRGTRRERRLGDECSGAIVDAGGRNGLSDEVGERHLGCCSMSCKAQCAEGGQNVL